MPNPTSTMSQIHFRACTCDAKIGRVPRPGWMHVFLPWLCLYQCFGCLRLFALSAKTAERLDVDRTVSRFYGEGSREAMAEHNR